MNKSVNTLQNGNQYLFQVKPKNIGDNIAEDVKLEILFESEKVVVENYDGLVGNLSQNSTGAIINVPIVLNRAYVKPILNVIVRMTQSSFSGLKKDIKLPVSVSKPILKYQVVLLNGISENTISQNSWPKFRVDIANIGTLDAKNVIVLFKSKSIASYEKKEIIGTINTGDSIYRDFSFFIRGDAKIGEMTVDVEFTQADFEDILISKDFQIVEQKAIVHKVQGNKIQINKYTKYSDKPQLYINSPNQNIKTYKDKIDLHGSIITFGPGNAIHELSISNNNKELSIIPVREEIRLNTNQITKRLMEDNKLVFDGVVQLEPGENVIIIKCKDRNNQIKEQKIKIFKEFKLGNIYSVIVGINIFENASYNLSYAASDSEKFYNFLQTQTGGDIPENQIIILKDQYATRAEIIKALTNLLGTSTREDTALIYIATHGVVGDDGIFYYLCHDTDINNLIGTGFSDKTFQDILNNKVQAGKIIIYLDACHSGLTGLSKMYTRRAIGFSDVNARLNTLAEALSYKKNRGVVTFSASSSSGFSNESSIWNGGIFTHCLLKGLKGEANSDGDGWINVKELDIYLTKQILAITKGKQRPKMNSSSSMDDIPLAKIQAKMSSVEPIINIPPEKQMFQKNNSTSQFANDYSNIPCKTWLTIPEEKDFAQKQVLSAINKWVTAWSSMNINEYISMYSTNFIPPNGVSRKKWELQRKGRLNKSYIRIKTFNHKISFDSCTIATVVLNQHYETKGYSDKTLKELIFEKKGNQWMITKETALKSY